MNSHDILINCSPQENRVALIEGGAVQELHIERALSRGIAGNIYLGRVERVLPGMQSAFIDIGLERAAFLHVGDVWQRQDDGSAPVQAIRGSHKAHKAAQVQARQSIEPIEKRVFQGQTLMVQVLKDPLGTKGARLTTQISIAGRLLVFLPQDDHIGVSQRIPAPEREALRERVQALAKDSAPDPQRTGGFILRTNAEEASDAELADDIAYLRKTWAHIREQATRVPVTARLYQERDLLERVLRDMARQDTTASIRIDSAEQFERVCAFARDFMPALVGKIQHYRGERPIFDLYNVDEEISRALARRVELKSGGYLIVDQTEALTTIDVNTGAFVGARNFDDTIFKTNLEAAQAIARQLRLRNLGGIIIVDFIDMARADHREQVWAELRRQLARDRVKTALGQFSPLGLLEMTRKRTRESLSRLLCEPCPACSGRGSVKTVRSVCYDILREILREAHQFNPREFRVIAAPAVIEMFLDEESQHLATLSEFIARPIALQAEAAMVQECYDIVLVS